MASLGELLDGIGCHGACKGLAECNGDNSVILDSADISKSGVVLELRKLLFKGMRAVVVDDNDLGVTLDNGLPAYGCPCVSISMKMFSPPA